MSSRCLGFIWAPTAYGEVAERLMAAVLISVSRLLARTGHEYLRLWLRTTGTEATEIWSMVLF